MRKFLLIVVGVVAVGLAIRYTVNRSDKPKAKPPKREIVVKPEPAPEPTKPEPAPEPPPELAPEKPEPPRIAGSAMIIDAEAQHFTTAPGVVFYCDGGALMAAPKTGGAPQRVADSCSFDLIADAHGVFYCSGNAVMRVTAGTQGSRIVADDIDDCFMAALDGKYAYFIVPAFDDVKDPGVYRVERSGGTPERIHATRPKEQFMVAADIDAVWIGAWSAGTISKLAKAPGAKARTVVTGQKGIVDLGVDSTSLYWYAEGTGEVRRRKKTGGAIEVIGREVDQEPIVVADGHAYWFEGPAGQDKRLMHLAPGAAKADQLASGLRTPSLRADSEGVYVSELDREGIFMFKR